MIRNLRVFIVFALAAFGLEGMLAGGASAATAASATSGADRLFLGFVEEASIIQKQWWEGQLEFTDGSPVDATIFRAVVAIQPMSNLEVGGRVGFGSTDAPSPTPDGSGATDLDVWGKWGLGTVGGDTDFSVGGVATVPTGDDTAGLGNDAFDVEAFGSLRHRLPSAVFAANVGLRVNGDGQISGKSNSLKGKTSGILGAGIIFPVSDQVSLMGELRIETERFDGADSDFRVLGGVNWRPFSRGILRGAVTVGLTDGAPDGQLTLGYAYTF